MSSSPPCKRSRTCSSDEPTVQPAMVDASTSAAPTPGIPLETIQKKDDKSNHNSVPPHLAMQMSEWQQDQKTVKERDSYIYDTEMFTDCIFSIYGEDNKLELVSGHRLYLSKSSPVFAAMFRGDFKEEKVIHVPDVNLEAFRAMLDYIYHGEIDLEAKSFQLVLNLLYTCKKYLLPTTLLDEIYGYLWKNIYPDNVWTTIKFAESNDEPQLEEAAWKVVESKTAKILGADNFTEISRRNLEVLVEKNNLNCSEMQLFEACVQWAISEAHRLSQSSTADNLRNILKKVFENIRFQAMDGRDFSHTVVKSDLLTTQEMFPILVNFHAPNSQKVPKTISSNSEPRKSPRHSNIYIFGSPPYKSKAFEMLAGDYFYQRNTSNVFACASITLPVDSMLLGLEIPTQCKYNMNEMYMENLTLVFCTRGREIIHTAQLNQILNYDSSYTFSLSRPIDYREGYIDIDVYVIFNTSGRYPVYRNMQSNKIKIGDYGPFINCWQEFNKKFKFFRNIITCNSIIDKNRM